MKKTVSQKRHKKRGDLLTKEIRALAARLVEVHRQAKALGIFIHDRQLLNCPGCGLMVDVDFQARARERFAP